MKTETASYKELSLRSNIYNMENTLLICNPSHPLISQLLLITDLKRIDSPPQMALTSMQSFMNSN